MTTLRLENKVAIVTGAAQGIGASIAELFAEHGAWVLLADVDREAGLRTEARIRQQGGHAQFAATDVAKQEEVDRAVTIAAGRSGRIDVLINGAALLEDWHDALEATPEQWQRGFDVTLMGAVRFTQGVLPWMLPHNAGSIVNIASVQGLGAGRNSAAYTSIKHAIIGLTRSVACDFGPHNIRANALCPGPIETRISPPPGSELYERQLAKTMLGRRGEPREVAWAALFLASDESSFITGAAAGRWRLDRTLIEMAAIHLPVSH